MRNSRILLSIGIVAAAVGSVSTGASVMLPAKRPPERMIMTRSVAAALAAGSYQGTIISEPVLVTRVTARISVVSGGGAGTTVFRVSDGVSNCDCTMPCSTTASGVVPREALCTGACAFSSGSSLALSVNSTTCTTTQPSVLSLDVHARPL